MTTDTVMRRAVVSHDPETVRLRRLLARLRPDCADPMEPPPREVPSVHVPMPRDPTAEWGGIPRAVSSRGPSAADASAAAVLAAVDALPAPSPVVLRAVRDRVRASDGVRGAALVVCEALGIALPERLQERRDAAFVVGRLFLWSAARALGEDDR